MRKKRLSTNNDSKTEEDNDENRDQALWILRYYIRSMRLRFAIPKSSWKCVCARASLSFPLVVSLDHASPRGVSLRVRFPGRSMWVYVSFTCLLQALCTENEMRLRKINALFAHGHDADDNLMRMNWVWNRIFSLNIIYVCRFPGIDNSCKASSIILRVLSCITISSLS